MQPDTNGAGSTMAGEARAGREVLRLEALSKTFPGTRALDHVGLVVEAGEVHALVGHNGSGKSTLIKILSGYHQADPGARAYLDGAEVPLGDLAAAHRDRLGFVHQDLGLILELNAVDNLAIRGGYRRNGVGSISWPDQREQARQLMAPFDHAFDLDVPLSKVTPVERTILAIAASLQGWHGSGGLLVLDEPTAILPPREVGRLFEIVRRLRDDGAGVLYVSHRLDEIFSLADRVTVLRGGQKVTTAEVASLDKSELVRLMLGDEARSEYRPSLSAAPGGDTVLEIRGLSGNYVRDVSFDVAAGEVIGIAGLPADGRDELPRLITDRARRAGGVARLVAPGAQLRPLCQLPAGKVVLLPPDRTAEGVLAPMTVEENLSLSVLDRLRRWGRLHRDRERALATSWIDALGVIATGPSSPISILSGGNQQKVLLGRVLARDPAVLVMSEPTAGVDVGARHAIYDLVAGQARAGLGVVVTSSDIDDLLAMCRRVLVLRHGRVIRELSGPALNEHQLIHAMEDGPIRV